jgi:hypothetical protein
MLPNVPFSFLDPVAVILAEGFRGFPQFLHNNGIVPVPLT